MFSRDQLRRAASLTDEDFVQLGKCRRPHNRLGFAYQVPGPQPVRPGRQWSRYFLAGTGQPHRVG
jgi:hypothetical protein